MYRIIFLLMGFVIAVPEIKSQNNSCFNNLDSAAVLQLVSERGLIYRDKNLSDEEISRIPSYQPKVSFDPLRCVWKVSSQKFRTTRKGKCKHTNGCTIVTTRFVEVDANTKKIISKKKIVEKHHNYE